MFKPFNREAKIMWQSDEAHVFPSVKNPIFRVTPGVT